MSTHFWGTTSYAEQLARTAQLVFYGVLGMFVGPLALSVAWWLRQHLRWWQYLIGVPFGWWWLTWWASWVIHHDLSPLSLVLWWWGGLVLASPLIAIVLEGWIRMSDFLRPHDLQDHLEEQQQLLAWKNAQLSRTAATQAAQAAPAQTSMMTLGVYIKGDMLPAHVGIQRTGTWLQWSEQLLNQHMLIVGTTGAGKSETIKRLVIEALQAGDRDIFFVDGKGDTKLGHEIAQLIYAKHGTPIPIFSLGTGEPSCVYHGFCGAAIDIYNRLGALIGVEDASDGARYYADINRDILQMVCYAPQGPPRSFEDLRQRLQLKWLREAYRSVPHEAETVEQLTPDMLASLLVRLRPLMRDFAPLVGDDGFVLEQSRGAIFSLRTLSVGDTARRFLDFLMEDFKDFAGKRQRRPGLLIIDEFGAFGNDKIVALLTMARSAELGVVLACQDVASLGDDETVKRLILANTRTKLLMATDFPEEIAELAGTIQQIEASIQHEEGQATGMGSARVQHAFRVDMNEAAQLLTGEAFLIRQRRAVKLKVQPVAPIGVDAAALAHIPKRSVPQPPPDSAVPAPPDIPDLDW